jgi:hypothetical protein
MATSNAAIVANFPYPALTALGTTNTDPTFETMQVVQVQLNANAASIHSYRDDDVNGHLVLKITPVEYTLRPPTNHPDVPAHADDATSAQIAEDSRYHAQQWH